MFLEEILATRITTTGESAAVCCCPLGTKPLRLSIGGQGIQKCRERDKTSLSDFPESCQVACLPCLPSKRSCPTLASLQRPLPVGLLTACLHVGISLPALENLLGCRSLLPLLTPILLVKDGFGVEGKKKDAPEVFTNTFLS